MAIIITESTCDLNYEEVNSWSKVEMLFLTVNFKEEHYKDKITLSNEEFYNKLREAEEIPTTSLLNPQDFVEVFEKYPKEELIVITLSHKLSGTYQSALIAKDMLEREDIYIVDSGTVTIPAGLLVKVAVQMNEQGVAAKDIVARLHELKDKVRLIAVVDTLKYLIKGGRLNSVQGAIGTALKLKPVITIRDGEILTLAKVRGTKAAFKEAAEIVANDQEIDKTLPISYAHTNSKSMLERFKQGFDVEGTEYMIGSVVGTHVGEGAVALAYFVK